MDHPFLILVLGSILVPDPDPSTDPVDQSTTLDIYNIYPLFKVFNFLKNNNPKMIRINDPEG
jgi:hypothetical protein